MSKLLLYTKKLTPVFAPIRPDITRSTFVELHVIQCGTKGHKETDSIYAIGSSYD